MRGIYQDLAKRLRRPNPQARVIVEALGVTQEDIFQREDQWDAADSLTNIDTKTNGLVELTGSTATIVVNATGTNFITDLNNDTPFQSTRVTFAGTQPQEWQVKQITARLHPKRIGGSAKEVATWRMQLWSLKRISQTFVTIHEVLPLGSPVDVTASGTVEADFTFDFSGQSGGPTPKRTGKPHDPDGLAPTELNPVMYVVISALTSTGEPAGNVAWVTDDAQSSKTTSGNKIQQATLVQFAAGPFTGQFQETLVSSTPRMAIVQHTYTTATLAFTTGNKLDMGASPTGDVEFMMSGAEPDDSAITVQARATTTESWVTVNDGDLAAVDNSDTGGADLSDMAKSQTYLLAITITTNTLGNVSPVLHRVGVQEMSRTNLDNLATVERVQWSLDPRGLKGEIAEAVIRVERDGQRDFRDTITQVLMDNNYDDLEFRLWVGHPDLDRHKWLLVDSFPILDDHDATEGYIRFRCVSALAHVRQALPVPNTAAATVSRTALEYSSSNLKAIIDDILDNRVVLPGRYRGQGVADAATTASKRIDDSDAKTELDAISHLAGGGFITSEGRVKFVDMFGDKPVVHLFDEDEVTIESANPGLRQRVPEFFVPFNYDPDINWYASEVRAFHADALADLGRARIDTPLRLDGTVAQWIDATSLAQTVGERHTLAFGTGVRLWTFTSVYAYPELEVGDLIAIKTVGFVMRDPVNDRGLRGHLWALGRIAAVHDVLGTRFTIWVKDLSDILPTNEDIEVQKPPQRLDNTTVIKDCNGNYGPNRHNEGGQAQDGDAVTFLEDFESVPEVTFVPQVALSYLASATASNQVLDIRATSLTVSGFTLRAKIITGAGATAIVDGFSASQNTAGPENGTVTLTADGAVAYSNLEDANTTATGYDVYYDVNATGMNIANQVTVGVWTNDGAASTTWTLRASRTYDNTMNATDVRQSFTTALGVNFDIRLRVSYLNTPLLSTATVVALGENSSPRAGVEYSKVTAGSESSVTPNVGDSVAYFAHEAP
jgi:hypothetical protein